MSLWLGHRRMVWFSLANVSLIRVGYKDTQGISGPLFLNGVVNGIPNRCRAWDVAELLLLLVVLHSLLIQ